MGKILSIVLGLIVVSFIAYKVMYGRMPGAGEPGQAPPEQLKNAKDAAKRIEGQQQEAADKALNAGQE
ncbi:MAG: hypothetical protein IT380_24110 [Myxococcales bacterium]|nr:hypothetical protein [Myxococcales bacterium]